MTAIVAALTAVAFLVLLMSVFRRSGDESASVFDAAVRPASPLSADEPQSLTAARWLVVNATTAGGLHFRVRPAIIELTEARLRDRHGIDLAHRDAPAIVGEPLWSVVRPDASAPDDRMAPGLSPSTFRSLIDRLEAL
jgi:hypothetical protein